METWTTISKHEFICRFSEEVLKPKKVWKDLARLLQGDFMNEIEVSVEISSLITNSLLAVERISLDAYNYLKIQEQTQLLSEIIQGGVDFDKVREFYADTFSPVLEELLTETEK